MLEFEQCQRTRGWLVAGMLATTVLSIAGCRSSAREQQPTTEQRPSERVEPVESEVASPSPTAVPRDNAEFREQVIAYVRSVSRGDTTAACRMPEITPPVHVVVSLHDRGTLAGRAMASANDLCTALRESTLELVAKPDVAERLAQSRFVVELTNQAYGVLESPRSPASAVPSREGLSESPSREGLEFVSGVVPVRSLDKATLRRRIDEGKAYLLRVMDPQLGGVHKYYRATTDSFEDRLHTIYTASTLYTLLAIHAHDHDEALREPIERGARFLLSMQRIAPGQPGHGAFHYSLDITRHEREPRLVVGTTSKTIFTLLELHELTGDATYLDSARLAGDWLLTMQDRDGRVTPELRLDGGDGDSNGWDAEERESVLYTGQTLSALSRLYEVSEEPRYLEGAKRTAKHLTAKLEADGCYLGDDYRSRNPVSSSWAILSLFDFARASGDETTRANVLECADELLERQIIEPTDVYRHGRWSASLSSSGNGWLAEVMATLHGDCAHDTASKMVGPSDSARCARYRDATVLLFRLLMQYTHGPESALPTKNPDMAKGGLFWNTLDRDVRTDSVCHAVNAYVFMLDHLPDGVLIELPEPDLATRLQPKPTPPSQP